MVRYLIIALVVVVADQLTKALALAFALARGDLAEDMAAILGRYAGG